MAGKRQIQQTRKNAPMLIYYQEGCTLISHGGKKLFMGALILILTQVALIRTPCVSVFLPELGVLRCDNAHLELRGLEVNGENSRQTRDCRLKGRKNREECSGDKCVFILFLLYRKIIDLT